MRRSGKWGGGAQEANGISGIRKSLTNPLDINNDDLTQYQVTPINRIQHNCFI